MDEISTSLHILDTLRNSALQTMLSRNRNYNFHKLCRGPAAFSTMQFVQTLMK